MSTKIYTKTGDKGMTALIGGTKVPKSSTRIEAYGTVDELNSFIGLLIDQLILAPGPPASSVPAPQAPAPAASGSSASPSSAPAPSIPVLPTETTPFLREVQDRLFTIGSSLACDPEKEPRLKIPDLREEDVQKIEAEIDRMTAVLPPMKSFLLPGGHVAVSTAHIARCVCRRAERGCVRLHEEQLFVEPLVLRYLNRLSDYLFVLARYAAHLLQVSEIPWQART
jgi:cob(I)alamin adenosyltransferase